MPKNRSTPERELIGISSIEYIMSAGQPERKIAVVTGSRAEYGLLYWLIRELHEDETVELQLIVTGMHLASEFGMTVRQIEADGLPIAWRVDMLLASDSNVAITKSTGLAMIGFADAYEQLRPDLVVVLGDRFEILAASSAALLARIPIAHLHGGELSEGAFDDALRHSITKMAQLHFVAAEEYRQRVLQLGESEERVFNYGAPGLDWLERTELLSREELESRTGIALSEQTIVVTFHPATLNPGAAADQMAELLNALGREEFQDYTIIITHPNADNEGRELIRLLERFVEERDAVSNAKRSYLFASLGQRNYLSLMQYVQVMVGNSSSGLIEAPAFRAATVNIGDRQLGRLKADSVIDCEPHADAIAAALRRACSAEFQGKLENMKNPYGSGGVSAKIARKLREVELAGLLRKRFVDRVN